MRVGRVPPSSAVAHMPAGNGGGAAVSGDRGRGGPPWRILLVEDEWLVAREVEAFLRGEGHAVVGPAATVEAALRLIAAGPPPDAALLDVNLRGRLATPVAAELAARGVPFLLVTAYAVQDLPEPVLATAPRLAKPASRDAVRAWLGAALATAAAGG